MLCQWPAKGPRVLWTVPVAQGYAGAAIVAGRVYHHDYDEKKSDWRVHCRQLATGKEIWSFAENRPIRPNHAITTAPSPVRTAATSSRWTPSACCTAWTPKPASSCGARTW